MSEPEIKPEWVEMAIRAAQNEPGLDPYECFRAALAAVAPLIRADERERAIASAIRGGEPSP